MEIDINTGRMTGYPCPDCGWDGPHTLVAATLAGDTFECGSCYRQFDVVSNDPDIPEDDPYYDNLRWGE